MKADDVPEKWMHAALAAYRGVEGDAAHRIRYALAAVAPLIAAAERERCAKVADDYEPDTVVGDGGGREHESVYSAASNIAAAIRAQGAA